MLGRYIAQRLRGSPLLRSRQAPRRHEPNTDPSVFIEENFSKHTLFVLDVGKRAVKFSLIGLCVLGGSAAAVYEGLHLYVEKKELAPETDDEVKRWEWDLEAEKWSGDPAKGGTDPQLGFKGRHSVRAAWMALNWGVGYNTAVVATDMKGGEGLTGPGGLKVIDAQLQRGEDFLHSAIRIAENRPVNSQTMTQLVLRHANVLERLGKGFLPQSRTEFERAWTGLSGKGIEAARVAAKLGDVHSRLSQPEDALAWWSKAIGMARGTTTPEPLESLPASLDTAPTSPSAQRLLSSTLVSLSVFYAQSGQLKQAQAIEESALNMLRSIPPPTSLASTTPPQALHALFLLQRSSVLSIHLAEVLYAQKKPLVTSIHWLTSAAESSERVACALTGFPPPSLQRDSTTVTAVPTVSAPSSQVPLPRYLTSRCTNKVAHGLLRDARRTSAEAWNLLGILIEAEGRKPTLALRCYERAVDWAGTSSTDSDTTKHAAEGILSADWDVYWGNYMRLKQALDTSK